jgi:2-polyprenyl-3-methyl-5-hydroxy-6-metoxy-1,4-benzoquinol methylase
MQPSAVTCPITGAPMRHVFTHRILKKYDVGYYYSDESGLLKTEKPYWLDEAYQDAIADTDTGIVARNINNCLMLDAVVNGLGLQEGRFLDLAGGYGLLARLMRDNGYDCYTTDKYCKNLFARAFEPAAGFQADALFAFEVLEHLEDPLAFLADAFSTYECRTLVFSTLTFSGGIPPADWWYYSFEGGQHIAFYQARTLALLAERLGCSYLMLNAGLHVITDRPVGRLARLVLTKGTPRRWYGSLVRRLRRRRSRTWEDHLRMKELMRGGG